MLGKQSHIPHSQTQTHKKFSWVRGVLILVAVLLILVGTTIGIIEGSLANNLSLLLNALGVIFTFLQWLLPVSAPSIPSSASSSLPPVEHTATHASQFPYSPQS